MGGDIRDLANFESVIASCELTDLIPGISQHFVSTVVMEENTQV